MWRYREKTKMTRQVFEKYAKMSSTIESTLEEIREESKRLDFFRKFVISIAIENFYAIFEFTLF